MVNVGKYTIHGSYGIFNYIHTIKLVNHMICLSAILSFKVPFGLLTSLTNQRSKA